MAGSQVRSVPVQTLDDSTTDPEYAVELARIVMPNKRSVVRATEEPMEFHLRSLSAGVLSLDRTRTLMDVRSEVDPVQEIVIITGTRGVLSGHTDDGQQAIGPNETLLVATGQRVVFESHVFESLNVRLPLETLSIVAAERTGIAPARFRFTGMRPVSAAMEHYWLAMAALAERELAGGGATLANPILHAATVDMFAAAALATFPNTTMTRQHAPGVGHLGSRSLRRAVAFMDAMASRPITISDVARAAGTTPRALQAAFRGAFDMTPMEYLQRVRLDGAHLELVESTLAPQAPGAGDRPEPLQRAVAFMAAHADSEVTVADVAAAAFVSVRTLQVMFRQHLGVTPMAHLRRIRLDRAHHDLSTADPASDLTVTAVAHRWGFSSPSRFAAHYKQAYGRSPGETLGARR